jgi:hypothetical protein
VDEGLRRKLMSYLEKDQFGYTRGRGNRNRVGMLRIISE